MGAAVIVQTLVRARDQQRQLIQLRRALGSIYRNIHSDGNKSTSATNELVDSEEVNAARGRKALCSGEAPELSRA